MFIIATDFPFISTNSVFRFSWFSGVKHNNHAVNLLKNIYFLFLNIWKLNKIVSLDYLAFQYLLHWYPVRLHIFIVGIFTFVLRRWKPQHMAIPALVICLYLITAPLFKTRRARQTRLDLKGDLNCVWRIKKITIN